MVGEVGTDYVSKNANIFLKERLALEGFSLRKKGSLTNYRRMSPVVEAISS